MLDLTANLTPADVRDAIMNADSSVRTALAALTKANDDTTLAAILAGICYYQAPVRGTRRVSGTLDEVAHLLKNHRWAGKNTSLGLPNLQTKEQLTRFALAGLVMQQGGVILTRKNDIVNTLGVLTQVNKAKSVGLGNEDIMDAIIGSGDAQAAYDRLVRAISQATPKAPKAKTTETTETETKAETKVTTDQDLVTSVLSILSGWKFDGTANIDMVFDRIAEIAGASIPATV